jgi:hypothetical protein
MSFSGAITTLEAILTAAGTATGKQFVVVGGEPDRPPTRYIAWWYEGDGPNPLIPETLTDHTFAENVTIRAYWPVGTRASTPDRTLELEVQSLNRAISSRLQGDRDLGANVNRMTIGDGITGWLGQPGDAWWRTLTIPTHLGFVDEETITP